MEKLIRKALDLGIKSMSFWGSSLENLKKRPLPERRALLDIYRRYFERLIGSEEIYKYETRINIIGRWKEQFPKSLKDVLESGMEATKKYKKHTLNFFLAYNGDDEMLEAIRKISEKYGKNPKTINPKVVKENLMTRDLPPVDFLVRTGGEPHLSAGFMMWDIADAQLYFSEKTFPDFGPEELEEAIRDYQRRERRKGK